MNSIDEDSVDSKYPFMINIEHVLCVHNENQIIHYVYILRKVYALQVILKICFKQFVPFFML